MEVKENAGELATHYRLQIQLDSTLEVVQPVDQGTDVSSQRPASFSLLNEANKIIKGVSLDQFSNIDRIAVVDECRHNLIEIDEISQLRTNNDFRTVSIISLILVDKW